MSAQDIGCVGVPNASYESLIREMVVDTAASGFRGPIHVLSLTSTTSDTAATSRVARARCRTMTLHGSAAAENGMGVLAAAFGGVLCWTPTSRHTQQLL